MAKTYKEAIAEMEEHFQVVAERTGDKWRWLGRKLKVDQSIISGIDADFKCTKEKAFQVLVRWFQLYGQAVATKKALIKALKANGQTSIAEELSLGGVVPVDGRRTCSADEKMTRSEESEKSAIHTQNGFNQRLHEELDRLLDSCIENVMTSPEDYTAMTQNLNVVQHLKELNTILLDSTPHEYIHENETAIGERRKTRAEKRCQRIEETIKLILQVLSNQGTVNQRQAISRTRPLSEILPRVTSEVNIQRRAQSVGSKPYKRDISHPITTSTNCILNRAKSRNSAASSSTIHDRISEETGVFVEKSFPPGEHCGSCLRCEAIRPDSEASSSNREQEESSLNPLEPLKLDFSTKEINTDNVEEENSKL